MRDWLFSAIAYVVPVGLLVISILALGSWTPKLEPYRPTTLKFSVLEDKANPPAKPQAMLTALAGASKVNRTTTGMSESPFWLLFEVPAHDGEVVVEFLSRHGVTVDCWENVAGTDQWGFGGPPLSVHRLHEATGRFAADKAGFALSMPVAAQATSLLCRTTYLGPARISVQQSAQAQYDASVQEFNRKSGLLDGGFLVLGILLLLMAIINRHAMYAVFAAWIVLSLRMAAIGYGWDGQWLGQAVPGDWLGRSRLITTALYYTSTVVLFEALFREPLRALGAKRAVALVIWSCALLLPVSLVASYQVYLPFIWVATALSVSILTWVLIQLLRKQPSLVAAFYSASLLVTLFGGVSEVLAAAIDVQTVAGWLSSVTAALSSGLLAALAVAAKMRDDQQARIKAQSAQKDTFDGVPIGLFSLDDAGRFVGANPAMLHQLGCDWASLNGRYWHQVFPVETWLVITETVRGPAGTHLEMSDVLLPNGSTRSFALAARQSKETIEGSIQDVTAQVEARNKLEFQLFHDSLTECLNRRGIERQLRTMIDKLGGTAIHAIAYVDLVRFKLINDLYGRAAGDEVLKHASARIGRILSGTMQLGRIGGDQFVILMPDTALEMATLIGQRIQNSFNVRAFDLADKSVQLSCAIGIVALKAGVAQREILAVADRACREAKSSSDRLVVYEQGSVAYADYQQEIQLIDALTDGSVLDKLHLVMQPIMSLKEPHDSLNFEVLLRMTNTDGTQVRPDRLLRAAESCGRTASIDRWVLKFTLDWLDQNRPVLAKARFVCINLSGASINDERFLADVVTMLSRYRDVASHVCYEITESVALTDVGSTRRFIESVRALGAKVALDDFGAGYTSFYYLRELPADILKIDGNFIHKMTGHPANVAIVEAIVSLAVNLGMKTIAEWAEDMVTVQMLHDIGVDYVQGFAIAKPMSPTEIRQAPSAASFIADSEIARMVAGFGDSEPSVPLAIDLLEPNEAAAQRALRLNRPSGPQNPRQ